MMERIRLLLDIEEIKAAKATYGKLVDECCDRGREAAAELAALFTEDAVCDFSELFGLVLHGHADIEAFFGERVPAGRAWMWHSFSNPIVRIEGDAAKSSWSFYSQSTGRDAPHGDLRVLYGRYADEYRRAPSGWKQSKLKLFNETRQPPG